MKIQASRVQFKEKTYFVETEHKPEEIDAEPEYFLPATSALTSAPYQELQLISKDDAGVWVRWYIVLSAKPLVVVPRGAWERVEAPKPPPVQPEQVPSREVFVPENCEAVWAGPHGKWRVKGVASGNVYAEHIADKELAINIAVGSMPYKIEEAKAA